MCKYCGHWEPIISIISRDTKLPDMMKKIVTEIECNRIKVSVFNQPINEIWAPVVVEAKVNFCPVCGAKMEEESENG